MKTFQEMANPGVDKLLTYEPGRPIEEVARELGFDPDEVVKLASNENALGPSPMAVRAMRKAAREMHRYPDGDTFYLKQALAAVLRVSSNNILPGNGSNELIELLGHAFLRPGTNIVMADRAFIVYRLVARLCGADVIDVPMREFTHDLDAMAAAVTPATQIVFISNPNNPTSTMVGQAEIDRFMQRVSSDVIICFDEAYLELLEPERQPDTLRYVREGRKVVVLRTFSKTYGLAGIRIGYAVAPEECVALLHKVRQPFNVNAMAQVAALAALADESHVRRTRNMVRRGVMRLQRAFEAMGLEYVPAVANFILVRVGNGREVFAALQREGVVVRPMDGYGLPEWVRVTVGTPRENARCVAALRKVLGRT
ncbi:MAG: histidinol-phosphate transaminase [Kiritimatiellae bacterium]|nr:histidinol-phosphate transaminase [Kiritimatiellia bacterium]